MISKDKRSLAGKKTLRSNSIKKVIASTGFYAALLTALILSVLPIFWLVLSSFRYTVDIFSFKIQLIPTRLTLEHYFSVFRSISLGIYLRNTIIVSFAVTAITLVIGTLASYAITRIKFIGQGVFQGMLLIARMLPVITALVPLFLIISNFKLLNTFFALIITHVAFKLPVTIWLMQGFIASIPLELEEAAKLDGCTALQILRKVITPLILPGFVASGVIAFLFTWNDLIIAIILASTEKTQPMSVGLTNFFLEHGIDWGPMSAAAVIMQVPAFLFAFFAQRYLIQGLTAGAVKG